jgi:ABC-type transport system substrate-binding protein
LNNLKKLKEEGTLSEGQYKRLEAIAEDIKRASAAETSGRGVGSDTVQKLAYSNMLNLQGIPNALRNFGPASFIGNVAGRVGDVAYSGANKQLKGQLAETLMDPAQAARLMEQAGLSTKAGPKTEKAKQLARMLMMQTTGQAFQGE